MLLLAVPLAVAVAVLHDPHWLTLDDTAQIEMRVRDVSGGHPPLLGAPGRVEAFDDDGNHPGPILYYALWPVYALLGGSGWALQVAATVLTAAGAALAVVIAHRRGGLPFAVAATGALALVLRAYGPEVLTSPWNPYAALVWWVVFLLAVWSALDGDLPLLPVVAGAGTACVQLHLFYVLPVVGLGLAVAVAVGRRQRREGARGDPGRRRATLRWAVAAVLLAALLAVPPLAEQLTNTPGNIAVLYQGFREPASDQAPFAQALDDWLERLDVTSLLRRDTGANADGIDFDLHLADRLPGVLVLAAWAAAVVRARRLGDRSLLRLHLVVGLAEGLTLVAMTRVYGPLWPYLVLSGWATGVLVLLATVWTFLAAPAGAGPGEGDARTDDDAAPGRLGPLRAPSRSRPALTAVTVVAGSALLHAGATVDDPTAQLADGVHRAAEATDDELAADPLGCGGDCRYLVRSTDVAHLVSPVYGFLLELEKRGHDVRLDVQLEHGVEAHRVITERRADAVLDLTVGPDAIEQARERPGMQELAWADPPGGEPPLAVFLVEPAGPRP